MKIATRTTSVALFLSAWMATAAIAGETLRLNAGNVRLEDQSAALFALSLAGDAVASGDEGYFVLQFSGAIPAQAETMLKKASLTPLRYLPDDAYLVRGTANAAVLAKSALPGVRAVATFAPEWKVSRELRTSAGASAGRETLVISTADAMASFQAAAEIEKIPGARIRQTDERELIVDVPAGALYDVAVIAAVEWIQRLPVFMTFELPVDRDPSVQTAGPGDSPDYQYTGHESGTKIMNFDAAWARGFMGEGQAVAVADTGLDTGALSTIFQDFRPNLINGFAVGLGAKSWEDSMGHGTHVAGSVAGNGSASSSKIKGGAHRAGLVSLGLWSAILDNLAPGTDFNRLISPARNLGARIQTNSWGAAGNFGAYDTFASKVDEYIWNNPDMLILFAAGNSGEDKNRDGRIDENSIGSPGTAKNVLTVGASENLLKVGGIQKTHKELRDGTTKWGVEPLASDTVSNNADGMAVFSSRGPTADGRLKPEIVAPGTNIVSNRSHHPKAEPLWGDFNADYVYSGGTSMATPLAAGGAAVAREYLVKARHMTNPSGALVKAYLIHTAHDMYPGQYGAGPKQELPTVRPNIHEGYGRVDMDLATSTGDETQTVDNAAGVGTGESVTINAKVGAAGKLRATLTWSDAPASPSAAKSLINDLDLQVVSAAGQVQTKNDHVNNTEMVELSGLNPGDEYRVVVKGVTVPTGKQGKQPYALVVSAQ